MCSLKHTRGPRENLVDIEYGVEQRVSSTDCGGGGLEAPLDLMAVLAEIPPRRSNASRVKAHGTTARFVGGTLGAADARCPPAYGPYMLLTFRWSGCSGDADVCRAIDGTGGAELGRSELGLDHGLDWSSELGKAGMVLVPEKLDSPEYLPVDRTVIWLSAYLALWAAACDTLRHWWGRRFIRIQTLEARHFGSAEPKARRPRPARTIGGARRICGRRLPTTAGIWT